MKKFIIEILGFVTLTVGLVASILFIENYVLLKNITVKQTDNFEYAFLGHSHSECAYNDTLIVNSKNFADSGESYFYTYQKVKIILKLFPNIKVFFIEFTNNQIGEATDGWIWKKKFMAKNFSRYNPYMSIADHMLLIRMNVKDYLVNYIMSIKRGFSKISNRDFNISNDLGKFRYLKRDKTDSLLVSMGRNSSDVAYSEDLNSGRLFKSSKHDCSLSNQNIKYLKKIVEICEKEGKKVYLVRSPLHLAYQHFNNEPCFQEVKENDFGSIELLDFNYFPLENSEFGDLAHLNYRGANKFSSWLNNLLLSGLMDSPNKQEYINIKISEMIKIRNSQ